MSVQARVEPVSGLETKSQANNVSRRQGLSKTMAGVLLVATSVSVLVLIVLLYTTFRDAVPWLRPELIFNKASRSVEKAGLYPALIGSLWVIALTAVVAFPTGVLAAIYLEEYAPRNRWTKILEINIANLAGVPSIVYGLLGLGIFVTAAGLGRSIVSGALTMALLILPVIIIASREAIRAVPSSIRQAAYGVGATKWQVSRSHVLPMAFPGILTGIILAISRAVGETAPLIVVGASAYVTFLPVGALDKYTVLPVQIYQWALRPQADFEGLTAAGIIVLLIVLLLLNTVAIVLRARASRQERI